MFQADDAGVFGFGGNGAGRFDLRDPDRFFGGRQEEAVPWLTGQADALDQDSVKWRVRILYVRRRRAKRCQHGGGLRTLDGDTSQRTGDIFECNIVGDDVLIHVLEDAVAGLRLRVEQETIRQAKQVHVRQDVALRVQKESVATGTRSQLLDVVGGNGVQQAGAVLAGGVDAAARGEVEPGRGV